MVLEPLGPVDDAFATGAERLELLTTSADRFFARLGWAVMDRTSAPGAVRVSRRLSELRPTPAVLMCRPLR